MTARQVKMIKHLAKIRDSDARILVIFMTIPGAEEYALVLHMDTLQDHIRDEIAELVETPEAQNLKDFGVLLKRKTLKALAPNISALDWLHNSNKLTKVLTKNIIMTPNSMIRIPLNTLLEQMKATETPSSDTVKNETTITGNLAHWRILPEAEQKQIAENLLFEAKMLREDAEVSAKQKEDTAKEILAIFVPAKKESKVVTKQATAKKTTAKKTKQA